MNATRLGNFVTVSAKMVPFTRPQHVKAKFTRFFVRSFVMPIVVKIGDRKYLDQ